MSLCLSTVKIEGIKREAECCCCFSNEDLFSMLEPCNFGENVEIYSTMIADCFQIELSSYVEEYDKNRYFMCKNCVFRLRDAIMLRCQIQKAYDRLQGECCTKRNGQDDISSEYSNLIDTKDHVQKYDISEYDNMEDNTNFNSGVTLANENLLKLKPVKIVLEKLDYKTIDNVFIISACGGSKAKKSQPSKTYFCNICNKLFRNLYAIEKHKKSHLGIKKFICDYCRREITRKNSLRSHILLHMGIKNVKCDLCDKYFVSKMHLSNHKRKSHSVGFYRNIGDKKLFTEPAFKYHLLSHSGVENESCDICKETFTNREARESGESGDESILRPRKKRANRVWLLIKKFEDKKEAELEVKDWSVSSTKSTKQGITVDYRCKKGVYRRNECPAGLKLLYHSDSSLVSLYKTDAEHKHDVHVDVRGLDDNLKEFIESKFNEGQNKPNTIMWLIRKANLEEPPKSKIIHFLRTLKVKYDKP